MKQRAIQGTVILLGAMLVAPHAARAWSWGGSQTPAETSSGAPPSLYLGPSAGWSYLASDFDGDDVLLNKQTGETSAVPKVSGNLHYGGVVGFRMPISGYPVDLGLELGYLEAHLHSNAGAATNPFNNHDSVLHEFSISAKGYFNTDQTLQPVVAAGYDIPWLNIASGVQTTPGVGKDEALRGGGFHVGAGLCWFFAPRWSTEFFLAYEYRRFTSLNGDSIQQSLVSNSVEPSVTLAYHFNFSRKSGS